MSSRIIRRTPPSNPIYGYVSQSFPDDPGSRTDVKGESKTWGIVYHLPKVITSHLPWDSTISLFYDRGTTSRPMLRA